jgi:hypothetical protein
MDIIVFGSLFFCATRRGRSLRRERDSSGRAVFFGGGVRSALPPKNGAGADSPTARELRSRGGSPKCVGKKMKIKKTIPSKKGGGDLYFKVKRVKFLHFYCIFISLWLLQTPFCWR